MFALALLATAASAQYYGGYGHGIPQVPQIPGYAGQHYAQPQSYAPAQSYGYGHAPAHAPVHKPAEETHVTNPWGAAPVDPVTTGWYSPTQQYSPPRIAYKPVADEVVFAICELVGGTTTGMIQFAQFPGKPILFRGTLDGAADAALAVTINELGLVGDGTTCDMVGDEFNPLAEIDKYGNPNPYQDPARGTINSGALTLDATGALTLEASKDSVILQNLAGKDSLIGRSISLVDGATSADCCVIALDALPVQYQPAEFYPKGNTANYSKGPGYYRH